MDFLRCLSSQHLITVVADSSYSNVTQLPLWAAVPRWESVFCSDFVINRGTKMVSTKSVLISPVIAHFNIPIFLFAPWIRMSLNYLWGRRTTKNECPLSGVNSSKIGYRDIAHLDVPLSLLLTPRTWMLPDCSRVIVRACFLECLRHQMGYQGAIYLINLNFICHRSQRGRCLNVDNFVDMSELMSSEFVYPFSPINHVNLPTLMCLFYFNMLINSW